MRGVAGMDICLARKLSLSPVLCVGNDEYHEPDHQRSCLRKSLGRNLAPEIHRPGPPGIAVAKNERRQETGDTRP